MEPNIALLDAADKVREAFERQGKPCGETLAIYNGANKICEFPWGHDPPHSWEPWLLLQQLENATNMEITIALRDSQKLEDWARGILKAELIERGVNVPQRP
jgi:hypothetical protein